MGPPYFDGCTVPRPTRRIIFIFGSLRSPVGMSSLQVNKHVTKVVPASNTNGISPLITMPDGKENDKVQAVCAAAGDAAQLNESVKTLVFAPASPGTPSFEWPEDAFSPSQLSQSELDFLGGRRRARIVVGEQDPEENPELFTPPRPVHRFFNPEYKWPSDEEAKQYVTFAFNAYHN